MGMLFKIYYLDDEVDLLEMFNDTFSNNEIEISLFSEPKKAIEAIEKSPPHLLFLDYRLPNTTGDKIASQLKGDFKKALISGDLNLKLESKFDAVFEKPYPIEKIENFIKLCIDSNK